MGGGRYRVVASGALLQRLFAIGCRELNFKLMDLIPLRIRTLALRYREKLLQAAAVTSVVVHSWHYYLLGVSVAARLLKAPA